MSKKSSTNGMAVRKKARTPKKKPELSVEAEGFLQKKMNSIGTLQGGVYEPQCFITGFDDRQSKLFFKQAGDDRKQRFKGEISRFFKNGVGSTTKIQIMGRIFEGLLTDEGGGNYSIFITPEVKNTVPLAETPFVQEEVLDKEAVI